MNSWLYSLMFFGIFVICIGESAAQCIPCDACGTTVFTVTAANSTNYTINGTDDPVLNFKRGCIYTFNVDVALNHPFYIKTVQVAGEDNQYDGPTTNQGLTNGSMTLTIGANAPDILYYICSNHPAMTNQINITDCTDSTNPTAQCKDTTIYLDRHAQKFIDSSYVNNGSSDNCQIKSMTLDKTNFDCDDLGENMVQMTVTDQSMNTNQCSATVTVLLLDSLIIDNTFISTFGNMDTYKSKLIKSSANLNSSTDLQLKAVNDLFLLPNFSIDLGAIMQLIIENCPAD